MKENLTTLLERCNKESPITFKGISEIYENNNYYILYLYTDDKNNDGFVAIISKKDNSLRFMSIIDLMDEKQITKGAKQIYPFDYEDDNLDEEDDFDTEDDDGITD